MSANSKFGIDYCDRDYGTFNYSISSHLDSAQEYYELAKHLYTTDREFNPRITHNGHHVRLNGFTDVEDVSKFKEYAEAGECMVALYSFGPNQSKNVIKFALANRDQVE